MLVVMFLAGSALGLWQLAVLVNWRGLADRHLARSTSAGAAMRSLPGYRHLPPPDAPATRRFGRWLQRIVAAVLTVAGFGLALVALLLLGSEHVW